MAEGGSGGGNDPAVEGRNSRIFHPHKPMKLMNKGHLTFTKCFKFKIYAQDWESFGTPNSATDPVGIMAYMTVVPWQALCFYLAPNEYLDVVRNNSYAKIKHADFEMEFKTVRTPFDANSVDAAEANGNLQFELQRYDGLEQMMPFAVADVAYPFQGANSVSFNQTYQELIERLYGVSFGANGVVGKTWPATMRERGLTWRPVWQFQGPPNGGGTAPSVGMYRAVNNFISCLPIGEYQTDCLNTNQVKMGEGYVFKQQYSPKNGILTMSSSAYNSNNPFQAGLTRINQPTRLADNIQQEAPNQCATQYYALYPRGNTTEQQFITNLGQTNIEVVEAVNVEPVDVVSYNLFQNQPDVGPQARTATYDTFTNSSGSNQWPCQTLESIPGKEGKFPFGNNWIEADATYSPAPGALKVTTNTFTSAPKTQVVETITPVTSSAIVADTLQNDQFGYGYNNELGYYSTANLENHMSFTSRNQPPIHHMPSMMIGAEPKTNKDNSIVNATFEFVVKTRITIETNHVHPTYNNMSYNVLNEQGYTIGWQDPAFAALSDPAGTVYGGKWHHNETDVLLNDENKFWNHSYGLAAKPLFTTLPCNTPRGPQAIGVKPPLEIE